MVSIPIEIESRRWLFKPNAAWDIIKQMESDKIKYFIVLFAILE